MYLYSVKDVKSGIYAAPFLAENDETAARSLQTTLITGQETMLKLYPEDYILYQIGEFNQDTGVIYDVEHIRVANCSELLASYQKTMDDKIFKLEKHNSKCKK